MSEQRGTIPDWISPRLQGAQAVVDALLRLRNLGKADIHKVATLALDETATTDIRMDAVTLLAAMENPDLGTLRALLDSREKTVAVEMLKRIRTFRSEWAVSELASRAKGSASPEVRSICAWGLAGFTGNQQVLDVLLEIAQQDADGSVRAHAIESLAEFRSPVVLDVLLSILETGSAGERFWALYSLGTIRDRRAAGAISRWLEDKTEVPNYGTVSDEAKWALEQIAQHPAGRN